MIEYQKDANDFLNSYEELKIRYYSLRNNLKSIERVFFEHEFIDDDSSVQIFMKKQCKTDFVRIPSNTMDIFLDKLVIMEYQLNKFSTKRLK